MIFKMKSIEEILKHKMGSTEKELKNKKVEFKVSETERVNFKHIENIKTYTLPQLENNIIEISKRLAPFLYYLSSNLVYNGVSEHSLHLYFIMEDKRSKENYVDILNSAETEVNKYLFHEIDDVFKDLRKEDFF